MRTVILHGHMFKNAGSSFDSALRKAFGGEFIDHRDDKEMRKGGEKYLANYLSENPEVKALSSHHLCSSFPGAESLRCLGVYFFRDPIERVLSVYNFERAQPVSTVGSKMAKELDLIDYVRWRLQDDVAPTIRNFQTLYVGSETSWRRGFEADRDMLTRAIGRLQDQHVFFGKVDSFDRDFKQIKSRLLEWFPDASFKYETKNSLLGTDYRKKTAKAHKELSPVMGELVSANLYDIALYQYVCAALEAERS